MYRFEVAVPEVDLFSKIVVDSIIVAIVGYSITLSMAKIFAHKFNYAVDGNQELFSEVRFFKEGFSLGLSFRVGLKKR